MKFQKFQIKNYKGIKSLSVDLGESNFFCILGLNESGKTTLLKAIDMWRKIAQGHPPQNGEKQKIKPKFNNLLWTGEIAITATINITEYKKDLIEHFKLSENTTIPENIAIKYYYKVDKDVISNNYEMHHDLEIPNIKPDRLSEIANHIAENSPYIIYYDDFNMIAPSSIDFSSDGSPQGESTIWHEVLNDALISLTEDNTNDFQKDIIPKLFDHDNKDTFSNSIRRLSGHINNEISNLWTEQLVRLGTDISQFKEVELKHNILDNTVSFSFRINTANEISFELSERSKGFIWFFCFVLFTTLRKHRYPNSVFLLDEPASNLHGNIQEKVIEALIDLSDKNTVIYTTHSPYMLHEVYLDNTHLMINKSAESLEQLNDESITIEKASHYINRSKNDGGYYVRPLYDYLGFVLPTTYPINNCVLVEGIQDFKHLKFFQLIASLAVIWFPKSIDFLKIIV